MDADQASRPQLTQRSSSNSAQHGRSSGPHVVGGGRGGLRVRNASSKNLSKLGKLTAGHAGSKVSIVRNASKTNLRKNQSETSLQYRQRNRPSGSPPKSERSSSVTRRASAASQVVLPGSAQRRPSATDSYIPQANLISSFDPTARVAVPSQPSKQRGKKRSSKDLSSGKKRAGDHPFEFDGDDEFDDEAWEDERSEVVSQNQVEMEIPDATYNYYRDDDAPPAERKKADHTIQNDYESERDQEIINENKEEDEEREEEEEEEEEENVDDATQAERKKADRKSEEDTEDRDQEKGQVRISIREGKKPLKSPPRSTFQKGRGVTFGTGGATSDSDDTNSETEDNRTAKTQRTSAKISSNKAVQDNADMQIPIVNKDSDDGSGTDSSPDTVVLAPTTRKPPPSALREPKAAPTQPALSTDTSPVLTMKTMKKVQIDVPVDEIEVVSPSTSGEALTTPSISDTRARASANAQTKRRAPPQYEFLSKAQRDRASLMQEAHPYPPSAWRDQFLSRAIPHVNDVNDVYTQKFTRRLDRRVDGRLNNLTETTDPLLDALRRAQARGALSAPDENSSTATEPPRPSGIQGWLSRLGGGKKEEQKPQTKEEIEAQRLERWTAMMDRYEWRVAQDDAAKMDRSKYIDVET